MKQRIYACFVPGNDCKTWIAGKDGKKINEHSYFQNRGKASQPDVLARVYWRWKNAVRWLETQGIGAYVKGIMPE